MKNTQIRPKLIMNYFKILKLITFFSLFSNLFCMEDQGIFDLKVALKEQKNSQVSYKLLGQTDSIYDEYLSMLLYGAALKGRIEVVREILKSNNVDVNYHGDVTGNTPLIAAIENKRCDIAELLLNHPNIEIDRANFKGITPILVTVNDESMLKIFKNLFDRGANLRACYENGDNILHKAATPKQNLEYVKLLLSKSPELINQTGEHGISPIDRLEQLTCFRYISNPQFSELVNLFKMADEQLKSKENK